MDFLRGLIVDSKPDARIRLKSATQSVTEFKDVDIAGSPEDGIRRIGSSQPFDVVFISKRFSQSEIDSFVAEAKALKGAQDAAFVILLAPEHQNSASVVRNVLEGCDGFLVEPFSVDSISEMVKLASFVKSERNKEREARAIRFLMEDVSKQLDRLAYIKRCGFDLGPNIQKLEEMCNVFKTLSPERTQLYFDLLPNVFAEASPPTYPNARSYKGVSDRVRKRMEARVLKQMEQEHAEDEAAREQRDESSGWLTEPLKRRK